MLWVLHRYIIRNGREWLRNLQIKRGIEDVSSFLNGQDCTIVSKDAHLGDKAKRKCKDVFTIHIRIVVTLETRRSYEWDRSMKVIVERLLY